MVPPEKPASSSFPFDVATTQAARTLIRIHQLLRGEVLKHRTGEAALVELPQACRVMSQIEEVLAFMGVEFDASKLKPRRARPRVSPLNHGEIRAGVLSALKRAGTWLTYGELADAILQSHGVTLADGRRKHFLQKVREATHMLKSHGAVVCEHAIEPGNGHIQQRWRLSTLFD